MSQKGSLHSPDSNQGTDYIATLFFFDLKFNVTKA